VTVHFLSRKLIINHFIIIADYFSRLGRVVVYCACARVSVFVLSNEMTVDLHILQSRSSSKVKVQCRREKNVAKVVGATSSEGCCSLLHVLDVLRNC